MSTEDDLKAELEKLKAENEALNVAEVVLGLVQLGDAEVADGHEALQVLAHLHDHAVVEHAADRAVQVVTHGILIGQASARGSRASA